MDIMNYVGWNGGRLVGWLGCDLVRRLEVGVDSAVYDGAKKEKYGCELNRGVSLRTDIWTAYQRS